MAKKEQLQRRLDDISRKLESLRDPGMSSFTHVIDLLKIKDPEQLREEREKIIADREMEDGLINLALALLDSHMMHLDEDAAIIGDGEDEG
jgi:hypothetical protein